MSEWLRIALSPPVKKRAWKYAVIVGAVLIIINHADALWRRDIDAIRILKMVITVIVPYLVSTFSSVGAIRDACRSESVCKDIN